MAFDVLCFALQTNVSVVDRTNQDPSGGTRWIFSDHRYSTLKAVSADHIKVLSKSPTGFLENSSAIAV